MKEEDCTIDEGATANLIDEVVHIFTKDRPLDVYSISLFGSRKVSHFGQRMLQDIDFINFVGFPRIDALHEVGRRMESLVRRNSSASVYVDWVSKDGPWKPKLTKKRNIGIHLNVQSKLEIWRRVVHHTNLAKAMFRSSETLYGQPLIKISPIAEVSIADVLQNHYGISALKNLLMSAVVSLYENRESVPFFEIFQYCVLTGALNFVLAKGSEPVSKGELPEFLLKILGSKASIVPRHILEKKSQGDFVLSMDEVSQALDFLDYLIFSLGIEKPKVTGNELVESCVTFCDDVLGAKFEFVISKEFIRCDELLDMKDELRGKRIFYGYLRDAIDKRNAPASDRKFVSIYTPSIFAQLSRSPDFALELHLPNDSHKKVPLLSRTSPYDAIVAAERGVVTLHQILIELAINSMKSEPAMSELEDVSDLILKMSLANILSAYNIPIYDQAEVMDMFAKRFGKKLNIERLIESEGNERVDRLFRFLEHIPRTILSNET